MSYQLINLPIYEQIANSIYFYNSAPCNMFWHLRQCNMEVIKQHVRNWCEANEQTVIEYYHEPGKNEKRHLQLMLTFNGMPLSKYQLLKWLESIEDNISTRQLKDTLLTKAIDLQESYVKLDHIVRDLALSIAHDQPQYVNTKP
jgi:hypothetical protein